MPKPKVNALASDVRKAAVAAGDLQRALRRYELSLRRGESPAELKLAWAGVLEESLNLQRRYFDAIVAGPIR